MKVVFVQRGIGRLIMNEEKYPSLLFIVTKVKIKVKP